MDEASITLDSSAAYTVETEPVVEHPRFFSFIDWKGELGYVSARFDFSELPDVLHGMAIDMIQQQATRTHVGDMLRPRPPAGALAITEHVGGELSVVDEPETEPRKLTLFQRIMGRTRRG